MTSQHIYMYIYIYIWAPLSPLLTFQTFSLFSEDHLCLFLDFPSGRNILGTFVGGYKDTAIAEKRGKPRNPHWLVRKRLTMSLWPLSHLAEEQNGWNRPGEHDQPISFTISWALSDLPWALLSLIEDETEKALSLCLSLSIYIYIGRDIDVHIWLSQSLMCPRGLFMVI